MWQRVPQMWELIILNVLCLCDGQEHTDGTPINDDKYFFFMSYQLMLIAQ